MGLALNLNVLAVFVVFTFVGALLLFIYAIFAMTLYIVPPGVHAPS